MPTPKPVTEPKKEAKDQRILAIAARLKELRKEKGYSSAEIFAYENSLNRVSYWRIENGQNFTMKMLLKILDIHQLSMADFFASVHSGS